MLFLFLRNTHNIFFFNKIIINNKFQDLESRIGYTFKDKRILEESLMHKSLISQINYERLEFLGDSLLNIIISEWLYKKYPKYDEGLLTQKRAQLVNKKILTKIAKTIFVEDDLIIGNSIQKDNIKTIDNIFADVFESVLGAIYIDGGIEYVKKIIHKHLLVNSENPDMINENFKGILIEKCHLLGYKEPVFKTAIHQYGFEAELIINDTLYKGIGNTKKNAEIDAAKSALKKL